MKYTVFLTLVGPGGRVESPMKPNPIEATSIQELLTKISLPENHTVLSQLNLSIVALRIAEYQTHSQSCEK